MSKALEERVLHPNRASLFAALGDETRLALLTKLSAGPSQSISALTLETGLTRQAVTKHLKVLEEAGFVHAARVGRERRYVFKPVAIDDLRRYLDRVSAHWDEALARLKTMLEDDTE